MSELRGAESELVARRALLACRHGDLVERVEIRSLDGAQATTELGELPQRRLQDLDRRRHPASGEPGRRRSDEETIVRDPATAPGTEKVEGEGGLAGSLGADD